MSTTFALALIAALVFLGACAGYALGRRDGFFSGHEKGYREGFNEAYLRGARK